MIDVYNECYVGLGLGVWSRGCRQVRCESAVNQTRTTLDVA